MSWLRLMEENLHQEREEAEQVPSEAPVVPVSSPTNKRVIKLLRDMWPAYLIEVLVIILGISITVALENWRDRSRERTLEAVYTENLRGDVDADRHNLEQIIASTRLILDDGKRTLAGLAPGNGSLPDSTIYRGLIHILGRPKFLARDGTFTDLKSSGNISVIHDLRLRNAIFRYYSICNAIHENQEAEQQTTITISGPYFLKKVPIGDSLVGVGQRPLPPGLRQDPELRGNVLLRVSNRDELLSLYLEASSAQDVLLTLVNSK